MRLIITGHRDEKLANYDKDWIKSSINSLVCSLSVHFGLSLAYSGMASGVDLWLCESCLKQKVPFIACVPFKDQESFMDEEAKKLRTHLLSLAVSIMEVRNSWMVEHADRVIVVFDGNKGGTHNVFQQLIEKKIPFHWVNPVSKVVWFCGEN